MSPLPSRRPLLAALLVSCAALGFAACGGTSVQHVADDSGGTGGTGGTTGGTGQGATAGVTSGWGGDGGGTGGTTGGTGGTGVTTGGTGSTMGGTGAMPGAGGTTAGSGGGTLGGTGGTSALTCDGVVSETQAELARIQSCRADSECGQVLEGTSCGCTRDLVARFDADATRFHELNDTTINGVQCNAFASTCDCPKVNGFACAKGRCTWNYVNDDPPPPACTPATIGTMCVVGTPLDSGDALLVGAPLMLTFQPAGCYSSSCTKLLTSSCDLKADMNDFYVFASMCLAQNADPTVGCTDDCGGGGQLTCNTEYVLTEGTHTVHFSGDSSLDLTFKVPSVVNDGSLCVTMDHLR